MSKKNWFLCIFIVSVTSCLFNNCGTETWRRPLRRCWNSVSYSLFVCCVEHLLTLLPGCSIGESHLKELRTVTYYRAYDSHYYKSVSLLYILSVVTESNLPITFSFGKTFAGLEALSVRLPVDLLRSSLSIFPIVSFLHWFCSHDCCRLHHSAVIVLLFAPFSHWHQEVSAVVDNACAVSWSVSTERSHSSTFWLRTLLIPVRTLVVCSEVPILNLLAVRSSDSVRF